MGALMTSEPSYTCCSCEGVENMSEHWWLVSLGDLWADHLLVLWGHSSISRVYIHSWSWFNAVVLIVWAGLLHWWLVLRVLVLWVYHLPGSPGKSCTYTWVCTVVPGLDIKPLHFNPTRTVCNAPYGVQDHLSFDHSVWSKTHIKDDFHDVRLSHALSTNSMNFPTAQFELIECFKKRCIAYPFLKRPPPI